MTGINKKYTVKITTLTPISIGAGAEKDWVKGVDFVIDNRKLYRLNIKKIVDRIGVDRLSTIFANKNEQELKSLLAGQLEEVSDAVYDCPLNNVQNDIKSFIKIN